MPENSGRNHAGGMLEERREQRERLVQTLVFLGVVLVLAAALASAWVVPGSRQAAERQTAAVVTAAAQRTATAQAGSTITVMARRTAAAQAVATMAAGTQFHWIVPPTPYPGALFSGSNELTGISWSPDGRLLAVGTLVSLHFYDTTSWAEVKRLADVFGGESLAFSPDGSLFAATTLGELHLWETGTWRELGVLQGNRRTSGLEGAAFSPDGTRLATAVCLSRDWSRDPSCMASGIWIWDITGARSAGPESWPQELVLTLPAGETPGLLFSPDGQWLAATGGVLRLWLVDEWQGPRQFPFHSVVRSTVFSPDSALIASGSADGQVYLEDMTGKEVRVLSGTGSEVESVTFSPDGVYLATGTADGELHLWEVATGREVWRAQAFGTPVQQIAFAPDGTRLAAISGAGSPMDPVRLWAVPGGEMLMELAVESGRPE